MSLFDLIAAALIAVSALIGFQRGAVKELVGLLAFTVSAIAALAVLPITSAMAETAFHPHLIAVAVAVVAGFAVVYVAFKLLGNLVSAHLHDQAFLGGVNRSLGLLIGGARALILLGLFALVFDRATPAALKPASITGAFLYPLASASGRLIGAFAPKSIGAVGSMLGRQPGEGAQNSTAADEADTTPKPQPARSPRPAHRGKGYDQRTRDQVDRLVEGAR